MSRGIFQALGFLFCPPSKDLWDKETQAIFCCWPSSGFIRQLGNSLQPTQWPGKSGQCGGRVIEMQNRSQSKINYPCPATYAMPGLPFLPSLERSLGQRTQAHFWCVARRLEPGPAGRRPETCLLPFIVSGVLADQYSVMRGRLMLNSINSFGAHSSNTNVPDVSDDSDNIFYQCLDAGGDVFESDAPPTCNKDLITTNLAAFQRLAADQGGSTLASVVTVLNVATTANSADDFATVMSNLQTIVNVTEQASWGRGEEKKIEPPDTLRTKTEPQYGSRHPQLAGSGGNDLAENTGERKKSNLRSQPRALSERQGSRLYRLKTSARKLELREQQKNNNSRRTEIQLGEQVPKLEELRLKKVLRRARGESGPTAVAVCRTNQAREGMTTTVHSARVLRTKRKSVSGRSPVETDGESRGTAHKRGRTQVLNDGPEAALHAQNPPGGHSVASMSGAIEMQSKSQELNHPFPAAYSKPLVSISALPRKIFGTKKRRRFSGWNESTELHQPAHFRHASKKRIHPEKCGRLLRDPYILVKGPKSMHDLGTEGDLICEIRQEYGFSCVAYQTDSMFNLRGVQIPNQLQWTPCQRESLTTGCLEIASTGPRPGIPMNVGCRYSKRASRNREGSGGSKRAPEDGEGNGPDCGHARNASSDGNRLVVTLDRGSTTWKTKELFQKYPLPKRSPRPRPAARRPNSRSPLFTPLLTRTPKQFWPPRHPNR
ncbi:hypothetical protein K438DRAFT_1776509 [Mycena galopus ATCC 62051]|nr:hypothetical protein K438DRAFT_1776509 [Mycena galopus ATCC 62051]